MNGCLKEEQGEDDGNAGGSNPDDWPTNRSVNEGGNATSDSTVIVRAGIVAWVEAWVTVDFLSLSANWIAAISAELVSEVVLSD